MNTNPLQRSVRHRQRYQQIVGVFLRHGFGFLFEHLGPEWAPRASLLPVGRATCFAGD